MTTTQRSAKRDEMARENAGAPIRRAKRNLKKRKFIFGVDSRNFYKLADEARYNDESVARLLNRIIASYLGTDQPKSKPQKVN